MMLAKMANTRFIKLTGEINIQMPEHVVHRVADALNAQQKPIRGLQNRS